MKKLIVMALAVAGLGAGVAQGIAADLPVKARPMVAPPPSWTGCYIGGHVGYGWSKWTDRSLPNAINPGYIGIGTTGAPIVYGYGGGYDTDGFVGGGQFGCDKQFGQFVLGAVIDISWTDQKADSGAFQITPTTPTTTGPETASVDLKYFGTARARLGYLVNPDTLIYATGGLAYARAKMSISGQVFTPATTNFSVSGETSFLGWTAGAGFDWRFMPNWTLGVEYLHLDLGDANFSFGSTYPNVTTSVAIGNGVNMKLTSDVVRATLNYRF